MYKKISLCFCLCSIMGASSAMHWGKMRLPAAQQIKDRIDSLYLGDFLHVTQLHEQLGSQERTPLHVACIVEAAIASYDKASLNHHIGFLASLKKGEIIAAIFKDFPHVVNELKHRGAISDYT